jgi:hypothetical protein
VTPAPERWDTNLDGLLIKSKTLVLVGEEFLDLQALVALELNHLSHALGLRIADDSAIASEILLDDLEDLLVVKLAGNPLDSGQGLPSITLYRKNNVNIKSPMSSVALAGCNIGS